MPTMKLTARTVETFKNLFAGRTPFGLMVGMQL
jgi:hypothetical protein